MYVEQSNNFINYEYQSLPAIDAFKCHALRPSEMSRRAAKIEACRKASLFPMFGCAPTLKYGGS